MAFAAHAAKVTKRVHPRQRAVYTVADRVEGQMARAVASELRAMQGTVKLAEVARVVQGADPEKEVYRTLDVDGGIESVATKVVGEMPDGMTAGARLAGKEMENVVVLDLHRPHVQRWLKRHTGQLITRMGRTTREAVSVTLRNGIKRGLHPSTLAKELRGQLGLTKPQAVAVARRRMALEAQGVAQGRIDQITEQYTKRLINYRARVIAHHESMEAVNRGRFELWKQLVDEGALPEDVQREWITSRDDAVCPICGPMHGQKRGLAEAFEGGDGSVIGGAPGHVGCRCTESLVD